MHNAHRAVKAKCTPHCVQNARMDEPDDRPDYAIRLEQARIRRGFKKPKDAVERFGWKYDTYIQHERGERGITRAAGDYARAYRVSKAWLLTGEGEPGALSKIVGKAGAKTDGSILFAEADGPGDFAPVPPGGSEQSVAIEVDGYSMAGWAEHGSLIYYEDLRDPPTEDMLGHIVVVGLATGEVLVKRLLRGSRKGRYDLESAIGPTIENAKVLWAAEITAIIPPRQAERIILRGTL